MGDSFTQYYNVIVRLDPVWVGMDLVTVTVIGGEREEGWQHYHPIRGKEPRYDLDVNVEAAIDTPATATNKSMHNFKRLLMYMLHQREARE